MKSPTLFNTEQYIKAVGRSLKCSSRKPVYPDFARIRYPRKPGKPSAWRYKKAKQQARTRGIKFALTQGEYEQLVKQPCFYCGDALSSTGVGLDREDSNFGYLPANVLPCCGRCNMMKGSLYIEDFIRQLRKIILYRAEQVSRE